MIGTGHVAAGKPALFFYPPPFRPEGSRPLSSPQTLSVDQITTQFAEIPEMSGVVLMVYWSTLCPQAGSCDFALIDQTLDYWGRRGKKVVLAVATMGFPDRLSVNGTETLIGATPDWVLAQVHCYTYASRVLGTGTAQEQISAAFPDFRDPRFVALVSDLVGQLARRYDGNPAIWRVRISTGMMAEDNPLVGPPRHPMPGYAESQWLDYCSQIARAFIANFRQTGLEFDIGRLSYMWTEGDSRDKAAVDGFLDVLFQHRALLAFDGLSGRSEPRLQGKEYLTNGEARSLRFIKEYGERGGRIALEAIGPLSAPLMQNLTSVQQALRLLRPDCVVFFHDVAAALQCAQSPASTPGVCPDMAAAQRLHAAAVRLVDGLDWGPR
jgi:hypothetical protein